MVSYSPMSYRLTDQFVRGAFIFYLKVFPDTYSSKAEYPLNSIVSHMRSLLWYPFQCRIMDFPSSTL